MSNINTRVDELVNALTQNETPLPGATGNGAASLQSPTYYDHYNTTSGGTQPPFSELLPFEQSEPLPAFPLGVIPSATRQFIYAAAEMIQAPVEMVGACVLGALEIACRGRYPIKLPNGHVERPCFYFAPIAPPSERKSAVISAATRPLIDYEIEYNQTHGGEVNQSKSELKLLEGRIANSEQQVIKAKKSEDRLIAENELHDLNAELAEFEATDPLRLFSADVTPEKLAAMLKAQGGAFALVSAEGGGLFENIGRYSDKGGLEIYLLGYSGDRVTIDRKNSESVVLERPALNIIALCQPSVISDLFSDRQKAGRGLLSRILYIKCKSRVGSRKAMTAPIAERITNNYHNLCYSMLASESKGELTYSDSGVEVYNSFFDEIEPLLTPDVGELSFMGDWAGKLPGNMSRIAGIIHCITAFELSKNPLDTEINAEETRAAVEIARFLLAHTRQVYAEQAEPQSISNACYLWERIKSLNAPQISKRELDRKTHGKQGFNLSDSLSELVGRGYIRMECVLTNGTGRPSETIIINPETQNIVPKVTKEVDAGTFVTFDTINNNNDF